MRGFPGRMFPGVMAGAMLLACVMVTTGLAWSDPIQPRETSPYADHTAARVGDTVTILIKDATSVVQRLDAQNQRDSQNNAFGLGTLLTSFFAPSLNNTSRSGSRSNDDHQERFESSLSVSVVAVKPNGNLSLRGGRVITLNGQRQELLLQGEVRPFDLADDNSVLSNRVTNLTIDYKGPLRGKARKGFIQGVLDIFF